MCQTFLLFHTGQSLSYRSAAGRAGATNWVTIGSSSMIAVGRVDVAQTGLGTWCILPVTKHAPGTLTTASLVTSLWERHPV